MIKRLFLILVFAFMATVSIVVAQDSANPTVAILRYGGTTDELTVTEYAVLDMLQAYELISADERALADRRNDIEGENITLVWNEAGWDLTRVNLMVESALDQDADVLVTLTTPVTRAAVNATLDMDEPPAVLFASVYNPVEAGISQASCVKPAHVTGSQIQAAYEQMLSLLQIQNPAVTTIGVIFSSSEASGIAGAEKIAELGEALGLSVESVAVTGLADFPAAAVSLAGKGVEALVLPLDAVTAQALPAIVNVANENGIPLFYPVVGSVFHGATFGIGFHSYYDQGLDLGRMLTAYLNGELDTATTGISILSGAGHGVNLDAAALQGIEIAQELIDGAEVVVQDDASTRTEAFIYANSVYNIEQLQAAGAQEFDAEFLQSLACTPEMIAEQQAELAAADE